jgi:hypothetical protein
MWQYSIKEITMKTRNVLIAGIAGFSLLAASAVIAGGPGCGGFPGYGGYGGYGPGPGMAGPGMMGPGMMGHGPGWGGPRHAAFAPEEMASWQLDALKKSLKLQPAQEGAWNQFAETALARAKQMGEARDEMWAKARTTPERMALADKLAKEREAGHEKVTKAMKALYETLTPEQRKVLDRRGPWVNG